jgi:GNAT superfamily N-acetyltransferase
MEEESATPIDSVRPSTSWESTRLFMRRPWLEDLPVLAVPAGCTVRAYQPGDLLALCTVLTRAFGDTSDEEHVRRKLIDAGDVEEIYVVAEGDRLLATASARVMPIYPGSGYLHWVAADPDVHGKGLGTLISVRVLQHFRERGLRDAVLETNDFRLPAIRAYMRLGFIPEYQYDDPDERMRWARVLPQLVR